ncbi:hypothetical protein KHO65_gp007 [Mycobacterium phage Sauce]|uniref:Uncharacterized protein n=1 Tax=Mycobacterium phage Sauce TaxID=2419614 RepID=A0A3G3M4U0_9CAUD|nr:hypothetical protein KHO65_gp007 [Mycobacterium phage Sauce]AYR01492.1 hypothetical protein SEA_SAUCE_8 [Mycobacterium phage Sauce]
MSDFPSAEQQARDASKPSKNSTRSPEVIA